MKNTLFENWLRTKVEQSEQSFDHDAEWALLRPKLEKKKRKRRPVFWFLLPIGLLAVSYFFFTISLSSFSFVILYVVLLVKIIL